MLKLNRSNYFSLQANQDYMSNSQYKNFHECEAKTMASLKGDWVEEPSKEFLVGSYVHSWQENRRSEFISEHPEMFKRDGGLKAEFVVADRMIETLENDEFAMYVLSGQKEVILTAEMFGTPWKIMIDSYQPEKHRAIDLKTTKNIQEYAWKPELREKVSFIEMYDYVTQATIYTEVERIANGRLPKDWLDFYIVAVSKQDVPDKEVISLVDPERYEIELINIKNNMQRILGVKSGKAEPEYCGYCDYCRSVKKLSRAVHYTEI